MGVRPGGCWVGNGVGGGLCCGGLDGEGGEMVAGEGGQAWACLLVGVGWLAAVVFLLHFVKDLFPARASVVGC